MCNNFVAQERKLSFIVLLSVTPFMKIKWYKCSNFCTQYHYERKASAYVINNCSIIVNLVLTDGKGERNLSTDVINWKIIKFAKWFLLLSLETSWSGPISEFVCCALPLYPSGIQSYKQLQKWVNACESVDTVIINLRFEEKTFRRKAYREWTEIISSPKIHNIKICQNNCSNDSW